VLHLTSEFYRDDALIIEDKLGLAKEIHIDEIQGYFKRLIRSANFQR
jgi:hypothetical protein